MRIAQCLEYPIGLRGGVSVLVETIIKELAARKHDIILVSADTTETLRKSSIFNLLQDHIPWNQTKPSISDGRRFGRQLSAARIDLAHFHLGANFTWGNRFPFHSPIYHSSRFGIPCVSTVHSVMTPLAGLCGDQKPLWFKLALFPIGWWGKMQQLGAVDCEIAVSQHDVGKLRAWYAPLKNRLVYIYHSRLPERQPAGQLKREQVILNVGHLAARKGQTFLAEAFAAIAPRYPEWKLYLAGPPNTDGTVERIHEIAAQHHLENRILLLGPREDAMELMFRAGIYVQASIFEALGLALQEAMFAGCASIGTRTGGIPELIEDNKTGLLVEPANVFELSEAIAKLISHPEQREYLGQAAADSIRNRGMTMEAMMKNHLKVYEKVLRRK
jgi:glycosyltransferase involved in cell wall biosynthesis